jgi:phosphatidylserine/phosphatidylglycerophosphate/cardiolipin synthase-like enzyme
MANERVIAAVIEIARRLPMSVLESVSTELHRRPPTGTEEVEEWCELLATDDARAAVARLLRAWLADLPRLPVIALTSALQAAGGMDEVWRSTQCVELAWTGPTAGAVLRRVDEALLEVVSTAQRELLLVTYVANRIDDLAPVLEAAVRRGVALRFVFESESQSLAGQTLAALDSLGPLVKNRSQLYVWPPEKRGGGAKERGGVLHAKCAVADESQLLISSANLTGRAMRCNMELGLLVRGGELPRQVAEHFRSLVQGGELRLVSV